MENESSEIRKIQDRCFELEKWILENAPHCFFERRHLVAGSRDRGYWAYGYLTALQDVMRLLSRGIPAQRCDKSDTSGSRFAA
jgi:hypothetical protein